MLLPMLPLLPFFLSVSVSLPPSLSLSLSLSQVANILFSTLFSGVFNLCSSLQPTDQGTCIKTSGKTVVVCGKHFRAASLVVFTAVRSTIPVFLDVMLLKCVNGFRSFQTCRLHLK